MKLRSGKTYSEPNPNEIYTFKEPLAQAFSIPYPIIKYITMYPSSYKSWKKLLTACKYFYRKNPVIPIRDCSRYTDYEWSISWTAGKYKLIDLRNISWKLWLHGALHIEKVRISIFTSKLYRCDLQRLFLFSQTISYDEYQILTGNNVGWVNIQQVNVYYANGTPITFDKLLKTLSQAEKITYFSNTLYFEPDTVKKMVDMLIHFKNLKCFMLQRLPETFDIETFINFAKTKPEIDFYVKFQNRANDENRVLRSALHHLRNVSCPN